MRDRLKPTLRKMRIRPSLWYNEFTGVMLIVYPDIVTQQYFDGNYGVWENGACASIGVLHVHWVFLGWL